MKRNLLTKYSNVFAFLLVFFLPNCSLKTDSVNSRNIDLFYSLGGYGNLLLSKDTIAIKSICTEKGYKSILQWSDSLKDEEFVYMLASNLNDTIFQYSPKTDSTLQIDLKYPNNRDGKHVGSLDMIISNDQLYIDQYWGGVEVKSIF